MTTDAFVEYVRSLSMETLNLALGSAALEQAAAADQVVFMRTGRFAGAWARDTAGVLLVERQRRYGIA